MKNKFKDIEEKLKKIEEECTKKSSSLSNLRGLTVLMAMFMLSVWYFGSRNIFALLLTGILIFVFIYLVVKHSKAANDLQWSKQLLEVNQRYIDRLDGGWKSFEDNGEELCTIEHLYGKDLDIVGKNSLFQFINTTKTFKGREKLQKVLLERNDSLVDIIKRQQSVRELSGKINFVQEIEATGKCETKVTNDPKGLVEFANRDKLRGKAGIFKAITYIPYLTLALFVFGGVVLNDYLIYSGIAMFLTQVAINIYGISKLSGELNSIGVYSEDLTTYKRIIDTIDNEKFESAFLKELQKKISVDEEGGKASIKALEKLVNSIGIRYNSSLYKPLNILLLMDYKFLARLEDWRENYGANIENVLDYIGDVEMLASLSVLSHTEDCTHFPLFTEKSGVLSGKNLGHPLISKEKRIDNDIDITDKIFIITGSNMAGKTTILRTIGINLVLAYAGAPVCGENLNTSIMDIFTSMRIGDNLGEGISTFYAELLKIKEILAFSSKKKPMIFLMDEIFRGTNSLDRIAGAEAVVKTLDKPWIIGGIATHDFELCDMQGHDRIKNYHFSESYEGDNIVFDYKIKDGIARTTNAQFLMRMVGLRV